MGCSNSGTVQTNEPKVQAIQLNDQIVSNKKVDKIEANFQKPSNIPTPSVQQQNININKRNEPNNIQKEKINDNLPTSTSYKDLPNYDLFEKFISIKKVQEYIQTNIYEGYAEVIDGIFNDIKPLIDELFKRFGLTYEIISENQTINCNGYNVSISKPDMSNSDYYLPLFFLNFWFYPPDAFHHKIIKKFIFCEELIFSTTSYSQPRAACPEWDQTHSMIYSMKIQDLTYLAEVMHHELFHYFDFMVSGSRVDSKIEADWNKLNPKGFTYGSGGEYERVYIDINKKDQMYFVSHYSMSQCCEDRAEIYGRVMTKTTEWKNELSDNVLKKFKKIEDFMKDHSPNYIGNKKNNYFVRLFNFFDWFYQDKMKN